MIRQNTRVLHGNDKNEAADHDVPLCVDLDGTLVRADLLVEGVARFVKKDVRHILLVLRWLLAGRATLKARVAARTAIDVATLPVNDEFLEWLRAERNRGRRIFLCTAASQHVADQVARNFDLFDGAFGSDGDSNLSGQRKARMLEAEFGAEGFDYAGNGIADLPIWKLARRAVVVCPSALLRMRIEGLQNVDRIFWCGSEGLPAVWIRQLRVSHWAKNILVFVPLLASHTFTLEAIFAATLAFLWFSLCASASYVLNDVMDLPSDRIHATKRLRPIASGQLPVVESGLAAVALLVLAIAGAFVSPGPAFAGTLLVYLAGTFTYSLAVKRIAMLDTLWLAGLYTIRIIAGAAAISVMVSFWLLAFSGSFFLSLAMAKRSTELQIASSELGDADRVPGRGYVGGDFVVVLACSIAVGVLSVLIFALYVFFQAPAYYQQPEYLLFACPLLLYWLCRFWLKLNRGKMSEDPIVFAARDKPSIVIGAILLAIILIAD